MASSYERSLPNSGSFMSLIARTALGGAKVEPLSDRPTLFSSADSPFRSFGKSTWYTTSDELFVSRCLICNCNVSGFAPLISMRRRTYEAPSTVAGLAFAPKGFRLAIAHYNGVTLWFPNASAKPETLEWKGSHLSVAFSPDGRFLVTAMQEPTLHGWRLADAKHMRMSGYSERVRSLSWAAGGEFLATSGSEQLILWPFDGKDGPMGKQPKLLAPAKSRVSVVACHPRQPVVAAGYADGVVVIARIDDGALIEVKAAGASPASALGWDADGHTLAFGAEAGEAGTLTF